MTKLITLVDQVDEKYDDLRAAIYRHEDLEKLQFPLAYLSEALMRLRSKANRIRASRWEGD